MSALPQALSAPQERKLVEFLDTKFLEITRNYRKRSQLGLTTLPTLTLYIAATRELLGLILQIPPVAPSGSLRTTFLLRLTGEFLGSISGYPAESSNLNELLESLDDLDQAWMVDLQSQVWDTEEGAGVECVLTKDAKLSPITQTERTRLNSLLMSGTEDIEEWLAGVETPVAFNDLFSQTLANLGELAGVMRG